MKYELTKEQIEEIICCVVDCGMDRDEACDYALETAMEMTIEDCEIIEELPLLKRAQLLRKKAEQLCSDLNN